MYKKGRKIRIDFTVKINNKPMSLQFIYNADKYKWDSYYFVDPKRRAFVKKKLGEQESDLDMDLMAQVGVLILIAPPAPSTPKL